jgi:GAF domain/PAS fold
MRLRAYVNRILTETGKSVLGSKLRWRRSPAAVLLLCGAGSAWAQGIENSPSTWDVHGDAVLVALVAIVAQSLLIVFLMVERKRRKHSQEQLAERLKFETLMAEIAFQFGHVISGRMEPAIESSMQAIHKYFGSRAVSIWVPDQERTVMHRAYAWPKETWTSRRNTFSGDEYPDMMARLFRGETVHFSNEMERDAHEDQAAFRRSGTRSLLVLPLQDEERTLGFLSLANLKEGVRITPEIVQRMQVVADILAAAMARDSSTKALLESELLKESLLESIQSSVAVIDASGVVRDANQHSLNAKTRPGVDLRSAVRVGENYLHACMRTTECEKFVAGIQAVLRGTEQSFAMEYEDESAAERRWYRTTAMRLLRAEGGAVISHLDITRQVVSEFEERRLQDELLRLSRGTEMGHTAAAP